MSNRLRQCLRLTHVRSIQHGLAALASEHAHRRVEALEMSADQLARLRVGFGVEPGFSSGAALASVGEIAMRLDIAREGLAKSISGARDQADIAREARLAARRKQESTQRLSEKTAAEAARHAEKKQTPLGKRRSAPSGEAQ
jgi:hypothetical protein